MEFDLSNIEISKNDIARGIRIPKTMTLELAEFIGIMVGDGHIGRYGSHWEVVITGNKRDIRYYEDYVNKLILEIFNIKFNITVRKRDNTVCVRRHSKGIFNFLNKIIGLPTRKDYVGIPPVILKNSKEIKAAFIRGLADADFCLTIKHKPHAYPIIQAASKSKLLMKQTKEILDEFNIGNCYFVDKSYYAKRDKVYIKHRVNISGYKNIRKYMLLIGFCNPHQLEKYSEVF